jgi:hypothetical protein
MIDRRTGLLCAALIVLMFIMAVWRIITLEQWTTVRENGGTASSLVLLAFPANGAFFVGVPYWGLRARADAAKLEPWRKWAAFLSIGSCGVLLLIQLVVIIGSLHVDLPLPLSAIGPTLIVMMMIMWLLAINQVLKLPYFERRLSFGGDLGPIYGPRFTRAKARVAGLMSMSATIVSLLAPTPGMASFVFVAVACVIAWIIAWRLNLARKWKRQQSAEPGLT